MPTPESVSTPILLTSPSVAGSETTATSIRATLLHIITNPSIYNKLVAEILTAIREQDLPSPVPDSAAKKLPYLQAVIKEGLRIWPPITGLMSKVVPPEGDTFRGMELPPGTVIGYSAFGLSRNKEAWGEDANFFRPERWMEGTAEEMKVKEAAVDLVFGHGRWLCLGKSVAYIELNKIIFEVGLVRFTRGLISTGEHHSRGPHRISPWLTNLSCSATLKYALRTLPRYVTLSNPLISLRRGLLTFSRFGIRVALASSCSETSGLSPREGSKR